MMLALQIEKNFTKDDISRCNLNEVCYGANT